MDQIKPGDHRILFFIVGKFYLTHGRFPLITRGTIERYLHLDCHSKVSRLFTNGCNFVWYDLGRQVDVCFSVSREFISYRNRNRFKGHTLYSSVWWGFEIPILLELNPEVCIDWLNSFDVGDMYFAIFLNFHRLK